MKKKKKILNVTNVLHILSLGVTLYTCTENGECEIHTFQLLLCFYKTQVSKGDCQRYT